MKLNGASSRDDLEGRALGIESRLQSIWLRVNSINLELTLLTRSNCLLPACTVNQPIVFRRGMEKRNRREANGSPTNAKGKKAQRDWKLGIGDRMRGESPTNRARGPKTGLAAIYRGYTGIEFKLEKARTRDPAAMAIVRQEFAP